MDWWVVPLALSSFIAWCAAIAYAYDLTHMGARYRVTYARPDDDVDVAAGEPR